MTRTIRVFAVLALAGSVAACGGGGTTPDDGTTHPDDGDGGGDVAPEDGGPLPEDGTTPDDGGTPPDDDGGPTPDDAAEPEDAVVPDEGTCTTPAPGARVNPAFAVTTIEVVRPDVFGTVSPTLDMRVTMEDIYVVVASPDLAVDSTTCHIEVGQAMEHLYPTPYAQFCTDVLCGHPPNTVTSFDASVACNAFETTAPLDVQFSLYPPAHPGSEKPLTIQSATVRGEFDETRENIIDATVTGGLLASDAAAVYPMTGTTISSLLTAAGIAMDYDDNGDTTMDGWQVELRFTGARVELTR
jgi:hypothetical protein